MFTPTTPLPRRGFWTVAHFGQTAVRLHWSLGAALLGIGLLTRLWLLRQYSDDLHWSISYGVTVLTLVLTVVSFVGREVVQGRVAAHHDLTISSLSFSALGGQTKSSGPPPNPRAEFQISSSGLFFTCLTTAFMFATSRFTANIEAHQSIVDLFRWMGWVNLILAALNLLPSAPLDGGRIVSAIFWHRRGSRTVAQLSTGRIAIATSALLVVAGVGFLFLRQPYSLALFPVASILFVMARSQIRRAVIARRFETTTAADLVAKHPPTVPDSLTVHQIAEWLPPSSSLVAVPVTRWNAETVGYLSPIAVKHLSEAERSWTTAKKLMEPNNTVSRCWATETIGKVVGREATPSDLLVVVHDSASKREIGTLTFEQISQLLRPPDFWGRSPIFPR